MARTAKTNLKIRNSGVPLGNSFDTLNFLVNISAVDSGGGIAGVTASAGGGFSALAATEIPNGIQNVFTFVSAVAQPSYLVVDNVWMKATSASGTVNWSWDAVNLQATLSVPASDDIFAVV